MGLLFLVLLVSVVAMVVSDMMARSALDLDTLVLAPVISSILIGLVGSFLPCPLLSDDFMTPAGVAG